MFRLKLTSLVAMLRAFFSSSRYLDVPSQKDFPAELRRSLAHAISTSGKSREEIATAMSEILGKNITSSQLDSWTAETRTKWRFPFEYAPAFEAACKTDILQRLLKRYSGLDVTIPHEVMNSQLNGLKFIESEIRKQRSHLQSRLDLIGDRRK